MSYPKLFRDLFQNDGAGDKLREDILPDIGKVKTVNGVAPDSSGNVVVTVPTKTSQLTNDSAFLHRESFENANIHLGAGTAWNAGGASFLLCNQSNPDIPGGFSIKAVNQDNSYAELCGTRGGVLTWAGNHVVRSVNDQTADAAGNVNIVRYSTSDLTAGTSPLATGTLYCVYE
jgi:hypothetical protein